MTPEWRWAGSVAAAFDVGRATAPMTRVEQAAFLGGVRMPERLEPQVTVVELDGVPHHWQLHLADHGALRTSRAASTLPILS
ncbi:hypothetical protein [Actinoplanes sp. NPDC051494]|uniref:hypothetical protein n=1 Tax=Actinoplanes sp. NPDC051494 TaxID=3363907 RepID=UPI0037ABE3B8